MGLWAIANTHRCKRLNTLVHFNSKFFFLFLVCTIHDPGSFILFFCQNKFVKIHFGVSALHFVCSITWNDWAFRRFSFLSFYYDNNFGIKTASSTSLFVSFRNSHSTAQSLSIWKWKLNEKWKKRRENQCRCRFVVQDQYFLARLLLLLFCFDTWYSFVILLFMAQKRK